MNLPIIQPKTCEDNISRCKAMCCKTIGFYFKRKPSIKMLYYELSDLGKADLDYWGYHQGVKIRKIGDRVIIYIHPHLKRTIVQRGDLWLMSVYSKCSQLTPDNKCALYGKPERPRVCVEGYTIEKKRAIFMPNCIYPPDPESVVMSQKEVEALGITYKN